MIFVPLILAGTSIPLAAHAFRLVGKGRASSPRLSEQERQEIQGKLDRFLEAELDSALAIMEMNPDREIFFLSRDATRLGKMARLLARKLNKPDVAKRLHFLDVSRIVIQRAGLGAAPPPEHQTPEQTLENEKLLRDYLAQQKLSKELIRAGTKVLFVDSGFKASIPAALMQMFPEHVPGQIERVLLDSMHTDIGLLRSFMDHWPGWEDSSDSPVHEYASLLPKGEMRCSGYKRVGKVIVPIHDSLDADDSTDGVNAAHAAEADRQTSKWLDQKDVIKRARKISALWAELRMNLVRKNEGALRAQLVRLSGSSDPIDRAIAADFIKFVETTHAHFGVRIDKNQLPRVDRIRGVRQLNEMYTPYRRAELDPRRLVSEVGRLVAEGDYDKLMKGLWISISRADYLNSTDDFGLALSNLMVSKPNSPETREIASRIAKDPSMHAWLTQFFFAKTMSGSLGQQTSEEISKHVTSMIETAGDPSALSNIREDLIAHLSSEQYLELKIAWLRKAWKLGMEEGVPEEIGSLLKNCDPRQISRGFIQELLFETADFPEWDIHKQILEFLDRPESKKLEWRDEMVDQLFESCLLIRSWSGR
jgi:hypothetical protein